MTAGEGLMNVLHTQRLTEWPILPSKMSLKIAIICQMLKIISVVNYWLNFDLFRPKKIVFRFKIVIFKM